MSNELEKRQKASETEFKKLVRRAKDFAGITARAGWRDFYSNSRAIVEFARDKLETATKPAEIARLQAALRFLKAENGGESIFGPMLRAVSDVNSYSKANPLFVHEVNHEAAFDLSSGVVTVTTIPGQAPEPAESDDAAPEPVDDDADAAAGEGEGADGSAEDDGPDEVAPHLVESVDLMAKAAGDE